MPEEIRTLRDPDLPLPPPRGSGVFNAEAERRRHELRLERIRAAGSVVAAYIQTTSWSEPWEKGDDVIEKAVELLYREFDTAAND